ncbi:RNA-binding protein [Actinomadura sp. DC4]|uniref:RNA-binding protein n=1 Tax=Actinomadura sp. DC4 TaxID=3055069 RepID=UPI0025AF655C|nr:RNA-binding protein [Actinomadura sp. DC4]MDN3360139.1 RNA-binding protein [Actinomadura sp. DC4]
MLPYVYRVTKYDPADRDEHGHYVGAEDDVSDHGPVEAAYLEAVAAFTADAGIRRLFVREPGLFDLGLESPVSGNGLAGLFPDGLSGYHDGAEVSVEVGLELVRGMLRESGVWCRLEVEGRFSVHVGWDQYVYVGAARPCERAPARTRALGLFPERLARSPYEVDLEADERRPADGAFWERVAALVATGRAGLLEENPVSGVSRWHRLVVGGIEEVRARLAPRVRVSVWPGLSADPAAVLASLPGDRLTRLVWEDRDGRIRHRVTDEASPGLPDGARAATALSYDGERPPLLAAVLPDEDGVLRARWGTGGDQDHR